MKILQNKSKIVIVMSNPPADNCPRIAFAGNSATIRDDYKGSLKLAHGLLHKMVK